MQTLVVDHPLVAQHLTHLRDVATGRGGFSRAAGDLASLLVYEATRSLPVETFDITTPLTDTVGVRLARPPLVVPILRAGLGMLGPARRLLPSTDTGFIGVARNEATHQPEPYMNSVPDDLEGRDVLVLDPMLATGGSMSHACQILHERNAGRLLAVCILAAPEGVARLDAGGLVAELTVAAIDDHLDDDAFIVPGLGDAGDRLFGTA